MFFLYSDVILNYVGNVILVHSPKYYSPIFVDDQFAKVFSCQNFPLYGRPHSYSRIFWIASSMVIYNRLERFRNLIINAIEGAYNAIMKDKYSSTTCECSSAQLWFLWADFNRMGSWLNPILKPCVMPARKMFTRSWLRCWIRSCFQLGTVRGVCVRGEPWYLLGSLPGGHAILSHVASNSRGLIHSFQHHGGWIQSRINARRLFKFSIVTLQNWLSLQYSARTTFTRLVSRSYAVWSGQKLKWSWKLGWQCWGIQDSHFRKCLTSKD